MIVVRRLVALFLVLSLALVSAPGAFAQETPAQEDDDDEKSVAPWVIGGIVVGGGAAAAIALSQDDDDDDDDDGAAPPADDGAPPAADADTCDDGDAVGTWTAETADNNGTRWTMTLADGGGMTVQTIDEIHGDPDMAMIQLDDGTWTRDECTLTVHSTGGLLDGSGEIAGNSVSIAGKNFSK
ncbi:MAG: hypothetical protein JXB04_03420 [Kiritimatiellae bacterium]|nr:hypothetical protein [Kiritimatiellia bacterium]